MPRAIDLMKSTMTFGKSSYQGNEDANGYDQAFCNVNRAKGSKRIKGGNSMKQQLNSNPRFVRYKEGAKLYSMSQSKFEDIAHDAGAIYKVNKLVLVNCDIFEKYLETFRVVTY